MSVTLFFLGYASILRLTQPSLYNQNHCCGIIDHGTEVIQLGLHKNTDCRMTNENNNRVRQKTTGDVEQSLSSSVVVADKHHQRLLSISYGGLWDSFIPFAATVRHRGNVTPQLSLSTLVTVCLRIHRDIMHMVC